MALLTHDQAKAVVMQSLKAIADLPSDVESATFDQLNDMDKRTFLSDLKTKLNALPYNMNDGTTSNAAYYDIDLTVDSISQWPTVKDCIDWIVTNQKTVYN